MTSSKKARAAVLAGAVALASPILFMGSTSAGEKKCKPGYEYLYGKCKKITTTTEPVITTEPEQPSTTVTTEAPPPASTTTTTEPAPEVSLAPPQVIVRTTEPVPYKPTPVPHNPTYTG